MSSPANEFQAITVLENGREASGALCGSHLGALGMSVTAYRHGAGGSLDPATLGWDWCKSVIDRPPTADEVGRADVVIDSASEPLVETVDSKRQIYCRLEGDLDSDAESIPELIAQARTGIVGYIGDAEREPIRVGPPVVTLATGLAAVQTVLAGLFRLQRVGAGSRASVNMIRSAMVLLGNNIVGESDPEVRSGHGAQTWAPPDVGYECADGVVDIVFHKENGGFQRFCEWLGAHEVIARPELLTRSGRFTNSRLLGELLKPHVARRRVDEVVAVVEREGALFSRRNAVADLVSLPQVRHLGLVDEGPPAADGTRSATIGGLPFTIDGHRPPVTAVRKEP